jgi:tetratricopeptide (TPR) repeat protein
VTASANQLFDVSVDQVRRGQLRGALGTLLRVLAADPSHTGALEAAGRICRLLGSEEDAQRFETLSGNPGDGRALFELGWSLVDQGRPDIAAALLGRCLADRPDDATVRRELAFARLQAGDFKGCLVALAPLVDDADLAESERLDVDLVRAEAALYAGKRDLCRELLDAAEELVPDDGQRERLDALHAQFGRAARWDSLVGLGLREWHYIQHAGVILKVAGGMFEDGSFDGRYDVLDLRLDMVAFLMQRQVHLLQRLGIEPEVVMATSPTAAPMAHALAARLGVPCEETPAGRQGRVGLLVAANAAEFGPLAAGLARNRAELSLFSLNLDWEHDGPVCPEVTGVLARRVLLPWETRYAIRPDSKEMREIPADARAAAEIGAELVAAMDVLPDDDGKAREEFESQYMPMASDLVLGNEDAHPSRRRFTCLSPCGPAPALLWRDDGTDDATDAGDEA